MALELLLKPEFIFLYIFCSDLNLFSKATKDRHDLWTESLLLKKTYFFLSHYSNKICLVLLVHTTNTQKNIFPQRSFNYEFPKRKFKVFVKKQKTHLFSKQSEQHENYFHKQNKNIPVCHFGGFIIINRSLKNFFNTKTTPFCNTLFVYNVQILQF